MTQPEKMELTSMDVAAQKREELKQALGNAFPDVFAEGAIDFDQLKRVLGEWVDPSKERFGLNWPGKAECIKAIQQPSVATLKPMIEESIDFDKTQNIFIEGDNLEVLKLLQKAYFGKIKAIYIDPPYNTGNEFIYPDKYSETLETYLTYTGQIDSEGRKFSTNSDTAGRYHSNWLNMMYPRIYLASNLLRDDGLIFISIDDHEIHNLRALCDGVFGEECFIGCVSRVTGTPTGGGNSALVGEVDYILVYSKSPNAAIVGVNFTEEDAKIYDKQDANGRYLTRTLRRTGGEDRREDRPSMFYPMTAPDGTDVFPIAPQGYESRWICGQEKYHEMEKNGLIEWSQVTRDGKKEWQVYQKFYLEGRLKQPSNFWSKLEGNKKASRDLRALFDGEKVFTFPKPVGIIQHILQLSGLVEGDIVLDFFAGSATTGHAVLKHGAESGIKAKYILVQLPESLNLDDTDQKVAADFCDKLGVPRNIAELSKERLRRCGALFASEFPMFDGDTGFKCFKLDRSNFRVWDGAADNFAADGSQLELHVDHISEASTPTDILYELLLKAGFELTTKVTPLQIAGSTVFSVENGAMLICLDKEITAELIDVLAERNPLQVICLDAGFKGNDQLKANAVQTFRARAQAEESEIVFRTV